MAATATGFLLSSAKLVIIFDGCGAGAEVAAVAHGFLPPLSKVDVASDECGAAAVVAAAADRTRGDGENAADVGEETFEFAVFDGSGLAAEVFFHTHHYQAPPSNEVSLKMLNLQACELPVSMQQRLLRNTISQHASRV